MNIRIGNGYDIHRLVSDRHLILGGIHIPHELGLLGHSDVAKVQRFYLESAYEILENIHLIL